MSILRDFGSIFFDFENQEDVDVLGESLLEQYKEELGEVFFDEIFVVTHYSSIRSLLERYKFRSDRSVSFYFSKLFCDIIQKKSNYSGGAECVLVSAPMHWTRYFTRGFNHMALIASKISKSLNIPYENILKTSFSRHQSRLSREERLKNRQNVFFLKKGAKIPRKVILIDDVVSTASTVNICAKVLKNAGVERIEVFVLATNK